jgi:hypothetical protein
MIDARWLERAALVALAVSALTVPSRAEERATAGGGKPNYDVREDKSASGISSPAFQRMTPSEQKAIHSRLQESISRQATELRSTVPSLVVEYSPILQAAEVVGQMLVTDGERMFLAVFSV